MHDYKRPHKQWSAEVVFVGIKGLKSLFWELSTMTWFLVHFLAQKMANSSGIYYFENNFISERSTRLWRQYILFARKINGLILKPRSFFSTSFVMLYFKQRIETHGLFFSGILTGINHKYDIFLILFTDMMSLIPFHHKVIYIQLYT